MQTPENDMVIMMADDDPDEFFIVRDALRENGFENDLRWCSNGEDLMDYLLRRGQHKDTEESPIPDVILLDLNMPKMGGRRVLADIKGHRELRHIPVIILTSSTDPRDIDFCCRTGAACYIEKAHSFDKLSTELTAAIRSLRTREKCPWPGQVPPAWSQT